MIWCDGVERWLNDGMPPRDAAEARSHARRCAGCAQAVADAVALEAMLATAATTARPAPAGFTDAVMARVAAERDEAGVRVATRGTPATPPWWLVFASEPGAAVALVMVPAVAAIALFLPNVREFLVTSAQLVIASSLGSAVSGATAASADASALLNAMSPVARGLLAIGLVPLLLWSVLVAPTWLAAAMSPRRGSPPRSRS